MNTEIYCGDFGTGKTAAMYSKIKALAEKKEKCLLFVPEQFSFDTERTAYFKVGAGNLQFVKVTGFSKLSREILKEFHLAKPVADDAVKLITMWKSIEQVKDRLLCCKSNTSGFCRLMLKTVAAFRNAGVSPGDYRKILSTQENLSEDLMQKAEDFLVIYESYDNALTENLDDKLDDVSRAALAAEKYDYFKGAHLFFDNFDSFSEVQKKLLSVALSQCESSAFCLSIDNLHSNNPCFLSVAKTAADLQKIDDGLTAVEFKTPYRAKNRDENPVEIYSAKTPYDEARLAAARIHRLVMEQNYRYRDILVLTSDSLYQPILAAELRSGEIPFFCDFPHPMTEKPVVSFVLQVLKALDLSAEEILKLAESGFKRIPDRERDFNRLLSGNEIYRLRTAAARYGLTDEDWQTDWSNDPRELLPPLEDLRKAIVDPLTSLREKLISASDGAEMCEIFMKYLLNQEGLKSTFIARSKAGSGEGTDYIEVDENAAEEHLRIWEALCDALTSMAYCLKDEKIDCNKYCSLLEEILSGINLANPPQVLDCVTVGDIERTRKASPKAVIILGANEGCLPRKTNLQSIFNYRERENLRAAGLSLYDSNLNRWSKERYFAKRAMELYQKRLILTCCRQSTTGNEMSPSPLLEEFSVKTTDSDLLPLDFFLNTKEDVKTALSTAYGNDKELSEGLEKLIDDKDYKESIKNSYLYLTGQREFSLSEATAVQLLTRTSYSPTALTNAFQCPFKYFCNYGLGIREQEDKDAAAPAEVGTAIHNIMRTAFLEGLEGKTEEQLKEIARKAILSEAERAAALDPAHSKRTLALYRSMYNRVLSLLKQAAEDMKTTGFKPAEFEKRVSYVIKDKSLPTGEISISGIADRIDFLEGGRYIRILDYKTGSPKLFSAAGVEYGIDLQMLLYLFSQVKEDKVPAQIGYFNAGKASSAYFESPEELTPKEEAKAWYENHPISGAIFDISPAIDAEKKYENSIRAKTGAKSKSYNDFVMLSSEKFTDLENYVNKGIILPKIHSLLKGEIDAAPLDISGGKESLPCGFCDYKTICGNRRLKAVTADSEKNLRDFAANSGGEK